MSEGIALFHVSPPDRRDSIREHGIDPSRGLDTPGIVWFYCSLQRAMAHAGGVSDVWQVTPSRIDLSFKTVWNEKACRTSDVVPINCLRLLVKGRGR